MDIKNNKSTEINDLIDKYIYSINNIYQNKTFTHTNYTEYSFRRPLGDFLNNLLKITHPNDNYDIFEEHSHYENKGNYKGKTKNAPDYTIYKNKLQTGVIETKRPEASLNDPDYQDQFSRYQKAFSFSIFTNYLEFHGWNHTKPGHRLAIAQFGINNGNNGIIKANEAVHSAKLLADDIAVANIQPIKDSHTLAIITANLSKMLSKAVFNALEYYKYKKDHNDPQPNSLSQLYSNFQKALIKNITHKAFAHLFAQTITYGMVIAKVNHPEGKFTRKTALNNTPSTDPFLKEFFADVMGKNIDNKIKWPVDRLSEAFSVTDIHCLLRGFKGHDPLISFYELFLKEFDNKMRKELGVWYTPNEIAKFIVKSVDYLLKVKLNLPNGLTSGLDQKDKIPVTINNRTKNEPRIQILDPAVGTGTFLIEALKLIYNTVKSKSNIAGIWSNYVKNDLIYQLNAFEILMAAYTVAHLRLYIALRNTFNGHLPKNLKRFHVYLTNALMSPINDKDHDLFAPYIDKEEIDSNETKEKSPIMIVIGNPPYQRKSQNRGPDINNLMKPYIKGLPNKNQIAVHDDCVKFIRLAESYIEKHGSGIVGYITNSSYLRAKPCWKMRHHLATVFDDIYIINLNGGQHEQPDANGNHDENVFGIKIPVAISIFVKRSKSKVITKNTIVNVKDKDLANIHYMNITGKRSYKLKLLGNNSIKDFIKKDDFKTWKCNSKNKWSFIYEGDINSNPYYTNFIPLTKIFNLKTEGIVTGNDKLLINNQNNTQDLINDLNNNNSDTFISHHKEAKANWVPKAMKELKDNNGFKATKIQYHPLMYSYIPYSTTAKSNKILRRPRNPTINKMINSKHTLGLVVPSGINNSMSMFNHAIISNTLIVNRIFKGDRSGGFIFPLRNYPIMGHFYGNFNPDFLKKFNKSINASYDIKSYKDCKNILAWIIAILNAPQFIRKYNNNLKDSFPRIPLPNNYKQFKELSDIGNKLIKVFTVDYSNKDLENCPFELCSSNNINSNNWTVNANILSKKYYDKNNKYLYINKYYYFNNVTYNQIKFQLGGYNLIYQWLYDHLGHSLNLSNIKGMQGMLISISKLITLRNKLKSTRFINNF